jgi:hypothetical protein
LCNPWDVAPSEAQAISFQQQLDNLTFSIFDLFPQLGSFVFGGQEADVGEASTFVGAVTESTVSGIDVGPLYEGAIGGEGVVGGSAFIQSATTGRWSSFSFFGGSLSAGPLSGLQVGIIYSSNEFGVYFESHKGPFAGGSGYAISF